VNHIHFFKEDIRFRLLRQEELKQWITRAIRYYGFQLNEINYVFCNDRYLLQLNKKFLKHHFYTDIITFNNSAEKKNISGDIFISYDRVKANAELFNAAIKDELHRVMIHGVLHLLGHNDKTKKDQQVMRSLEDEWLSKRMFK
jgi:probable rRNA maturation factor